ncbi:hypothetical protein TCAL_12005 [Tigriopus californicus]|uniref:Dynactin subunit 6 n=1 Tax=Tigriopus californicus TaxID=6832 RepID=A0A553PF15_TIGCA|nr:dynactin subunit 6-like [Tigriopus californicus]TRY76270.1 hypothetical protein TCAL_12005 [Tigriopus californicus]|eukprot:TCALIF_12005-PA protein Name:"Similar to dctn6 Dynactin subunit 6 (Xenopus tropicalis)" AED:0.05 eAED:0.05 QI:126/1/1/1/0/0.5/2/51/189
MSSGHGHHSSEVSISPGAVVCKESILVGEITIGARTVVHPKAVIKALAGPILIGENNLIEDQARIVNGRDEGEAREASEKRDKQSVMIIGNHNVFEVDCHSTALKIGDNNVLESKCFVGRSTELTNGCIVGAGCQIDTEEVLPENTVIYGSQNHRRRQGDRPAPQTLQIDFLTKVLPNYHHLKKPTKKM